MFLLFLCYNSNVYGGVSVYQALYRKYRPKTFDDVVGQDSIVKVLKNSIVNHKFCHAYMFFGSRGTGKTSLSKIFARAVNCLDSKDGNPCGKCKNCISASEKECVDIMEIDAASNNGVDEIRDLRNKINLVPAELKYKVYIIDEVHMLSIGAFNALLKTLEEPPEHAIFILATTDPQKVPETIISRCQCFSFRRISTNMLVERLKYVCNQENIKIEPDVLQEIAKAADGGMRDSLGMLDKLSSFSNDTITMDIYTDLNGMITKEELKKLFDAVFSNQFEVVLNLLNDFNDCGKNIVQIISQFMYFLRDILVGHFLNNGKIPYDISSVEKLITILNEKMFDIKKSGNPKIYIEILLLDFMSMSSEKIDSHITPGIVVNKNKEKDDIVTDDNDKNFDSVSSKDRNFKDGLNFKESKKSSEIISDSNEDEFISNISSDQSFDIIVPGKILNIESIMKARVNNAFALANKQELRSDQEKLSILNDYTFDQNIGYLVCEILNSKFRVACSDILVISYEYDSIVQQNLEHLEAMEDVFNKLTHSNIKLAIISDEEWSKLKNEYIEHLRAGEHYNVIDEPEKEFKKAESNDIISNSATTLFGDIVEIDE